MTIKLHHMSILIQLQQILWTCCVFFSSLNNTFFSVLIIIFSNKSYFCFNYTKCFFSFMPWIIFQWYFELFFQCVSRIIFQLGRELFFAVSRIYFLVYNALRALYLKWTGSSLWLPWATVLKGVLSKRMSRRNIVRERNERGFHLSYKICQELVVCAFVMRFSGPKI